MKHCTQCGKELTDDAVFCEYCGAQQRVAKTRKHKAAETVGIIAITILVISVVYSLASNVIGTSSSSSNSKVPSAFESTCPVTVKEAYACEQVGDTLYMGLEPHISSKKGITDIRAVVVFFDLYGDYVGDYEWEYSTPIDEGFQINTGEDRVGSAKVYVYCVLLSDGTQWGDKDATAEEKINYGYEADIDITQL